MMVLGWSLAAFFFLLSIISTYYSVKFGMLILRIEDVIELSLETMDSEVLAIEKVLEIPLFYDSPEIRRVHSSLKSSRDAVLSVADKLTTAHISNEEQLSETG